MIEFFFGALFIVGLMLAPVVWATKFLPENSRIPVTVVIFTITLTPSWGPATIVAVPVPFGIILGVGVIGMAMDEVVDLLLLFWWWHIVAFPVTAYVGLFLARTIHKKRALEAST